MSWFSENAKTLLAWCEVPAFEESPRKAAEAVSERAAFLVGHENGSAEAGVSGQPELIPALTGQCPGANVSGPEKAGVTAGETALQFIIDDVGSGA